MKLSFIIISLTIALIWVFILHGSDSVVFILLIVLAAFHYLNKVRNGSNNTNTLLNFTKWSKGLKIIAVIVIINLLYFCISSFNENIQFSSSQNVRTDVERQAIRQYKISAREGNRMQMMVQAGLCSACCLQAEDEPAYRYWKHIEDSLSTSLGMPTYR